MRKALINIKSLIQVRKEPVKVLSGKEMSVLPTIENAFLICNEGKFENFGKMQDFIPSPEMEIEDVSGKMILPTWCDSHTHIVYAGNRESEFVDQIKGLTYAQIAEKGGGILNSAKLLQETDIEVLYEQSKERLIDVVKLGTGAIEIKSGYGLTLAAEIKMLKVIRRFRDEFSFPIKATFLGAHALPHEFRNNRKGYIDKLVHEMIPKVAEEQLADFIDVFCETGYFTPLETDQILKVGLQYGLRPKVHVNQFTAIGGIEVAVNNQALSVDHLEVMKEGDFLVLKDSQTMPVALPGCSFYLGIPYTPGRRIIDMGMPLALASDYNPGSAPSGNMNFVVSAACIKMKLTPEEAINAATINGAYAMGLGGLTGSVTPGYPANFILTKPISSYSFLPYAFGEHQIEKVYLNGEVFNSNV